MMRRQVGICRFSVLEVEEWHRVIEIEEQESVRDSRRNYGKWRNVIGPVEVHEQQRSVWIMYRHRT